MPDYFLSNIPSQLWFAFRNRADQEQWPIRPLLLQLMQDYVDGTSKPTREPQRGEDDPTGNQG